MTKKELQAELQKVGLTSNQAQVYMALMQQGELRIQEIVRASELPRSTVYEALKGLFELSLAEESVTDNYKTIRPYPIGIIKHGLDAQARHFQQLAHDVSELESHITLHTPARSKATMATRSYKGRSGARQLYWNTLKAQDVVYVYSDWGRMRYVGKQYYEGFVAESRARGIKERVLINATPEVMESIRIYTYPGSPISRTRLEDIRVVDADQLEIQGDTLMYNEVFAQVYLRQVQITGFEVENRHFVSMQRMIFEHYWHAARPIKEILI